MSGTSNRSAMLGLHADGSVAKAGPGCEGGDASPDRGKRVVEVYARLVDVAESIGYRSARPLEPAGLSLPQFHVLQILRDAGSEGLLVHEVGARMSARAPNITRLVDKLEKKTLVRRERGDSDRRTVRLGITDQGSELLKALEGPVEAEVTQSVATLTDEDLDRLQTVLTRLTESWKPR